MFWVHVVFYVHWALMIAFALACLSVVFRPNIIARLYVTGLLAQQLILNGCMMTSLSDYVEKKANRIPDKNEFIMSHILHGVWIPIYKILFVIIIVTQIIEVYLWLKRRYNLNINLKRRFA